MKDKSFAIGIDIGGTKIAFALVDRSGNCYEQGTLHTHSERVEADIVDITRQLQTDLSKPLLGVGIGIPGQIENKTGVVRFAPNLHWHDVPLQSNLQRQLNMPVLVTNDVRAATYAEWHYGAGKNCQDLVCLFVGTGVGGGIVTRGTLYAGSSNCAGELGHMPISFRGPLCSCGNRGCLEAFAGGWAIAKRAQEGINESPSLAKKLIALVESDPQALTARHVTEAFYDGDPLAKRVIDEAIEALVAGCIAIVNALNPSRLILSGGVIHGLPECVDWVEGGIKKLALHGASEQLVIVPGELKQNAGVIGAASLIFNLA